MRSTRLLSLKYAVALFVLSLTYAPLAQTLPAPPVSPTPVTTFEYDAQGNRTKITAAPGMSGLNLETKLGYDAQYRTKESINPKGGRTQFEYDGGGRTTQVTDPRNLVTQYPRNGFGEATQLISPDTGTATQTYDEAGNLKTRVDSRGITVTYSYDALNRLTSAVYTQAGQTSLTVSRAYDMTGTDYANSVGRLSRTDHPSGASRFKYDPQGRVTDAIQAVYAASGGNSSTVVTTVKYGYTLGRLTSITYPSGRKLVLSYTGGQLTAMSLAKDASSTAAPLISQVKWEPFGGVSSWQWQMASGPASHERFYDQSGRIVRYRLGSVFRDVTYDAADRIVSYTHLLASNGTAQPALDQRFGYDENGRLTSVTTASASWSITYDANGNRTGVSLNGTPSVYAVSTTSNRLASINNPARSFGYDNAGNTTSDSSSYTAAYGLTGVLTSLTKGGVTSTFSYDADKRRIRKFTSAGASSTRIFVYDLDGQLLGEYDQAGVALKEYVWLGSTPIAIVTADSSNASNPPWVYFIHADHLDTPRLVIDQNGGRRWRWLAEPFGTTAPEVNPDNIGTFTMNLRFPGQYYDSESGLSYNYYRTYDSSIGRYTQSDPIGLDGGINTYTYGLNSPTRYTDVTGRCPFCLIPILIAEALGVSVETVVVGSVVATEVVAITASGAATPTSAVGNAAKTVSFAGRTGSTATELTHDVYFGLVNGERAYVGITNDMARRAAEWAGKYDLQAITSCKVTRDQARAIEQALINANPQFDNIINSIAPTRTWANEAAAWGGDWLKRNGIK